MLPLVAVHEPERHFIRGRAGAAHESGHQPGQRRQRVSLTLGITIGAAVLQTSSWLHGRDHVIDVDFPWAFLVVGLIAVSSTISIARLARDAGSELARRT